MENKYIEYIALQDLTTYHYKILLLLNVKSYSQTQLAELLNIKKQNAYEYVKKLEALNLVEVKKIEGRNKFYKAITNVERIQNFIPGQQRIELSKLLP